jgi:hypothetical protein
MVLPALVLVHGGTHAADCWDLTIDEIHRLEPELTVLAVACVPSEGAAMVDVVSRPVAVIARRNAKKGAPYELGHVIPRFAVHNGVPRARRRFMDGRLYPESSQIPVEKVSRPDMPEGVPRTWILTLRDRTHSAMEQRASIEAIGGVQRIIPIDTCHGLMVSEPERLAEILVERCRARS